QRGRCRIGLLIDREFADKFGISGEMLAAVPAAMRRRREPAPPHLSASKDVADLIALLHRRGMARGTIRKSVQAIAMVLAFEGITPNAARDRVTVKLP